MTPLKCVLVSSQIQMHFVCRYWYENKCCNQAWNVFVTIIYGPLKLFFKVVLDLVT